MLNFISLYKLASVTKRISFLLVGVMVFGCASNYEETIVALDGYHLQDGFELEVVAAEPLLEAPVAISFDDQGRIWVAEMSSYMADMEGTNEDAPMGKIKILEDRDGDGAIDHAKVFLDSLVLP